MQCLSFFGGDSRLTEHAFLNCKRERLHALLHKEGGGGLVEHSHSIRDDVKLAQLVRARDSRYQGRRFDSGKFSKNPRNQVYMDLRYIHPQARVLNYCFK